MKNIFVRTALALLLIHCFWTTTVGNAETWSQQRAHWVHAPGVTAYGPMFGWTEAQGNKYPSITDSANYHTIEALPPGKDEGVEGLRCPWYFMGASKVICRVRPGHVGCARGVQLVGDLHNESE